MCGLEMFQHEGELVVEPGAKESVVVTCDCTQPLDSICSISLAAETAQWSIEETELESWNWAT